MRVKYFKTDAGYIAVTDQSPKDFKNVLFIGKSGTDPLNVTEGVFTPADVRKLPEIARADMPAAWVLAFAYEKPVKPPKPPEPEPVEHFPLFDENGELLDIMPIRRRREPAVVIEPRTGVSSHDIGLIIGLLIGILCMVLRIL